MTAAPGPREVRTVKFESKRAARGITLVELLVVLAIVALLSALAIPAMNNLGLFARDELNGTAREMFSILRAAKIYAETYRVDTAVVYQMDNFVPPPAVDGGRAANPPGLPSAITDSVTGALSRVVQAAAVVYKLPTGHPFGTNPQGNSGNYVPVTGDKGIFKNFPGGMVLYLQDVIDANNVYYRDSRPLFEKAAEVNNIDRAGMSVVPLYLDRTGPFAMPGSPEAQAWPVNFPGHVFSRMGQLVLENVGQPTVRERYTVHVAPPPDAPINERLVDPGLPQFARPVPQPGGGATLETNIRAVPIEIYRSTGRVKIAS